MHFYTSVVFTLDSFGGSFTKSANQIRNDVPAGIATTGKRQTCFVLFYNKIPAAVIGRVLRHAVAFSSSTDRLIFLVILPPGAFKSHVYYEPGGRRDDNLQYFTHGGYRCQRQDETGLASPVVVIPAGRWLRILGALVVKTATKSAVRYLFVF